MSQITILEKKEKMLTHGCADAYFKIPKNRSGFEIKIEDVRVCIDGYDTSVLKLFLEEHMK